MVENNKTKQNINDMNVMCSNVGGPYFKRIASHASSLSDGRDT